MRSCWSGEDDQLVGGVAVTVVVRWVPGLTLGCGTRMARPVRNDWGPGAKWRRSDPQHVLRCSQGLPIVTTPPTVGRPAPLFLPGRIAGPVLAPGAVTNSMPEVKRAEGSPYLPLKRVTEAHGQSGSRLVFGCGCDDAGWPSTAASEQRAARPNVGLGIAGGGHGVPG
jgi:hypothetical protein